MNHPCLCDTCLKARDDELRRTRAAQDEAVFAAFLGIGVLQTMCRKANLPLAEQRCKDLQRELDDAFPGLVARSALR